MQTVREYNDTAEAGPKRDLSVLLVQSEILWEDPRANYAKLEELIASRPADLIVLPETFATGFSMRSQEISETMDGATVQWMQNLARSTGAVITGSVAIRDLGRSFNRLLWVSPDGAIKHYSKRHLFGLLGEREAYTPGESREVFSINGWRISPQICYDLRFPVWCRNRGDYDVLLFVANWPSSRHYAWETLLSARAIENQCYVVAVNRVGSDPKGLHFAGGSAVIDPLGAAVERLGDLECVAQVSLNSLLLTEVRTKFPFLEDRDQFTIEV